MIYVWLCCFCSCVVGDVLSFSEIKHCKEKLNHSILKCLHAMHVSVCIWSSSKNERKKGFPLLLLLFCFWMCIKTSYSKNKWSSSHIQCKCKSNKVGECGEGGEGRRTGESLFSTIPFHPVKKKLYFYISSCGWAEMRVHAHTHGNVLVLFIKSRILWYMYVSVFCPKM